MVPFVLAGAALLSCSQPHYGLADAKRMVLAAVALTPAAARRGSVARVELVQALATGWALRAYATRACDPGFPICSNLLGHYFVNRATLGVTDEDAGFDGAAVDGAATMRLRRHIARARCGA